MSKQRRSQNDGKRLVRAKPIETAATDILDGFDIRHSEFVVSHRCHDYAFLIRRWRAVARAAGMVMRPFAADSGFRAYCVRSKRMPQTGAIYMSAGIHGDEPASTEALIVWAEKNTRLLAARPFLIIPCINPWGLVNNSRNNAAGVDLNRLFHRDDAGIVSGLKALIRPFRFDLALTLHEDYDGQGMYIYEIEKVTPFWGEELLAKARPYVPIEGRALIDGREQSNGIVRRKIRMRMFRKMGLPEAVFLHLYHSDRVFTLETPSEFALDQRVSAQVAVVAECVRRVIPPI